jgi:hypothetical protein
MKQKNLINPSEGVLIGSKLVCHAKFHRVLVQTNLRTPANFSYAPQRRQKMHARTSRISIKINNKAVEEEWK